MPRRMVPTTALAALACALLVARVSGGPPAVGKYLFYVDAFMACSPGEAHPDGRLNIHITKFKKQHPNQLQRITGNVTVGGTQPIDDTFWIRARMDSKSSTDWRHNTFQFNFPKGACMAVREQCPGFSRAVFGEELNRVPCQIRPGTYSFEDKPVNWTHPKFPIMPYGHWKYRFLLGHGTENLICMNMEIHTIPR